MKAKFILACYISALILLLVGVNMDDFYIIIASNIVILTGYIVRRS